MKKRIRSGLGSLGLALLLLTLQAGCQKSISKVADLTVKIGPQTKLRLAYIPALKLYIGKYELSNKEYRCFRPAHTSGAFQQLSLDEDNQPVVAVSWNDANAFCAWLTKTFGGKDWRFRLPTEQEWETFAACGQAVEYPWGTGPAPDKWNYYGRENPAPGKKLPRNDGYRVACPVQKSGKNAWGLFGVGGNVWEWCLDADNAGKTPVKGASWADCVAPFLAISRRSSYTPDYSSLSIGFRIVAEPAKALPSKPQSAPTKASAAPTSPVPAAAAER